MTQHAESIHITINNYELEVVSHFTDIGQTITDDLLPEAEIFQRFGKVSSTRPGHHMKCGTTAC
ncbi:hypothetical protein DPMN_115351 [Dreissena polymorpha]|uniref:Uncharacterized protein n=1 Tax=Dreissena polymorpha TaxID=45954 RepID=A0A9D4KLQ0_DREPO|nr:hypothetical protein DPMN_115351 [Dreissena polymorpha]